MPGRSQQLLTYPGVVPVVPGSSTFTASNSFTVPNYTTLIMEIWGPGGGGAGCLSAALTAGGTGGASSVASKSLLANGGTGATTAITGFGTGGTASGGDTNTTGSVGTRGLGPSSGAGGAGANGGAGGAALGNVAAPGNAGTAPGGGGGGAHVTSPTDQGGAGAGGGGYCKKTYTKGVTAGAPSVGDIIPFVVGAIGAGGNPSGGEKGGDGALGQAKFTWS